MAQTLILDRSAASVKKWHEEADGSVVLQSTTDVTRSVEAAKERHNLGLHTTGMGDKHAASIPVPVLDMWARQRGKTFGDVMRDERLMRAFLQDPDQSVWRIWKGQI